MYYALGVFFSIILCSIFSVITTLWIFFKGVWTLKFYIWEYNDTIYFTWASAYDNHPNGKIKKCRFYMWDIWRPRYVIKWYWLDKWSNVKLHTVKKEK